MIGLAIKFIECGASPATSTTEGKTAIDFAAENGWADMLQLLINAYGDHESLRAICRTAAKYARENEHFDIAEWLEHYSVP